MTDAITEALRAAQTEETAYLWTPDNSITFTPAVVDQVFGDGRALFRITTINNRPAYWVVRGCSSWETGMDINAPDDATEFIECVDDIVCAIEEEFGSTDTYEMNSRGIWIDSETKRFIPNEWARYPTINPRDGCSWGRLDWPELPGIETINHPWARTNILAEIHAQ